MRNKIALITLLFLILAPVSLSGQSITRLVFFNLNHEAGTPEADTFFEKTMVLGEIPSLSGFAVEKVEGKNFEYDYVVRLEFIDRQGVQEYVDHRIHKDYLEEVWKENVSGGMLIDLVGLNTS